MPEFGRPSPFRARPRRRVLWRSESSARATAFRSPPRKRSRPECPAVRLQPIAARLPASSVPSRSPSRPPSRSRKGPSSDPRSGCPKSRGGPGRSPSPGRHGWGKCWTEKRDASVRRACLPPPSAQKTEAEHGRDSRSERRPRREESPSGSRARRRAQPRR